MADNKKDTISKQNKVKKSEPSILEKKRWLKLETKLWKESGIISDDQYEEILKGYNIKTGNKKEFKNKDLIINFPLLLTILGIALVLLGIGTFLTSTWSEIPQFFKLIVVFLSVINLYGVSYYLIYENKKYAKIGKWLITLSTLVYGASIFLLINIFNIKIALHIPFLIWAVGTLVIGFLEKGEILFDFSFILFTLWSIVALRGYSYITYLFPYICCVYVVLNHLLNFKYALFINIVGLCIWLNFVYPYNNYGILNLTYFLLIYLIAENISRKYLNFKIKEYYKKVFSIVTIVLAGLFTLNIYGNEHLIPFKPNSTIMIVLFLLTLAINVYSIIINLKKKDNKQLYLQYSILFTLFVEAICLISFGNYDNIKTFILSILYNLFYLGFLVYISKYGIEKNKKRFIILGLSLFALTVIMRVFDVNWTLIQKAIFFVLIGVVFIIYNIWNKFTSMSKIIALLPEGMKQKGE